MAKISRGIYKEIIMLKFLLIIVILLFPVRSFSSDVSGEVSSILDRTIFAPAIMFDSSLKIGFYAVYTNGNDQKYLFIPVYTIINAKDKKVAILNDMIYGKNNVKDKDDFIHEKFLLNIDKIDEIRYDFLSFKGIKNN